MGRFAKPTCPVCARRFSRLFSDLRCSQLHPDGLICRLKCTKSAPKLRPSRFQPNQRVPLCQRTLFLIIRFDLRFSRQECRNPVCERDCDGKYVRQLLPDDKALCKSAILADCSTAIRGNERSLDLSSEECRRTRLLVQRVERHSPKDLGLGHQSSFVEGWSSADQQAPASVHLVGRAIDPQSGPLPPG